MINDNDNQNLSTLKNFQRLSFNFFQRLPSLNRESDFFRFFGCISLIFYYDTVQKANIFGNLSKLRSKDQNNLSKTLISTLSKAPKVTRRNPKLKF
jgi:hypothetical protein